MKYSVYDLLDIDIETGKGLGPLRLGKTKEQLSEIFSDFDRLESDTKLSSSIFLRFGNSGYLCAIACANHYNGSLYGLLRIGSLYTELLQNFCDFYEASDDFFNLSMKFSKEFEEGIFLQFKPYPTEYNLGKSKLITIEVSENYYER